MPKKPPSPYRLACGMRLRAARRALGYSVEDIARLAAANPATFYSWEAGNAPVPAELVLRLWRQFRITADWILLGEAEGLPHGLARRIREEMSALAEANPPEVNQPEAAPPPEATARPATGPATGTNG